MKGIHSTNNIPAHNTHMMCVRLCLPASFSHSFIHINAFLLAERQLSSIQMAQPKSRTIRRTKHTYTHTHTLNCIHLADPYIWMKPSLYRYDICVGRNNSLSLQCTDTYTALLCADSICDIHYIPHLRLTVQPIFHLTPPPQYYFVRTYTISAKTDVNLF